MLSRTRWKHFWNYNDIILFNIVSPKRFLAFLSSAWSHICSLSSYKALRLCGVRVREKILHVSNSPALTTFIWSLPSSLFCLLDDIHADRYSLKHPEQVNACRACMKHRRAQELSKFQVRVCTMLDKCRPQLPWSHLCPGVECRYVKRSLLTWDLQTFACRSINNW